MKKLKNEENDVNSKMIVPLAMPILGGPGSITTVVTVTAILIALVKVRIIFREFMEVRHAPAWLRRLTDAWVLLVGAALLGSYFVGTAVA